MEEILPFQYYSSGGGGWGGMIGCGGGSKSYQGSGAESDIGIKIASELLPEDDKTVSITGGGGGSGIGCIGLKPCQFLLSIVLISKCSDCRLLSLAAYTFVTINSITMMVVEKQKPNFISLFMIHSPS
jgi:hypothetical protein